MSTHGTSAPLVSIIIVNYNGESVLRDCLQSVFAQTYSPFEVLVVDNGSRDASRDLIAREFPTVRLLAQATNLGFAGGNNLGVRESRGNRIVLLNNDTIVEPGWLEALVNASEPMNVAIVSSLVITEGIPPEYYERNGSINFLCHNIMRIFDHEENLFYGGGASLLFKKEILDLPFDDDYFAYAEDVYLGFRARFAGKRVLHTNASRVKHLGGVTAKRQRPGFVGYLQERNRLLTILLFFNAWTLLRILPYLLANCVMKLGVAAASARYHPGALLRAYGWLVMHPGLIRQKRRQLRNQRRVRDAEVISWMTCKLTNGESGPGRMVNAISKLYCRMIRLRTVEFLPAGTR